MDQNNLQNKIDNLGEVISKKQNQLAKLISKRHKQKQFAKEKSKKKLENELINRISEKISEGSGLVIKSVNKPLRVSSYLPLPEKKKKIKKPRLIFRIKMIMNALDGAIWHSYFLLRKCQADFKI